MTISENPSSGTSYAVCDLFNPTHEIATKVSPGNNYHARVYYTTRQPANTSAAAATAECSGGQWVQAGVGDVDLSAVDAGAPITGIKVVYTTPNDGKNIYATATISKIAGSAEDHPQSTNGPYVDWGVGLFGDTGKVATDNETVTILNGHLNAQIHVNSERRGANGYSANVRVNDRGSTINYAGGVVRIYPNLCTTVSPADVSLANTWVPVEEIATDCAIGRSYYEIPVVKTPDGKFVTESGMPIEYASRLTGVIDADIVSGTPISIRAQFIPDIPEGTNTSESSLSSQSSVNTGRLNIVGADKQVATPWVAPGEDVSYRVSWYNNTDTAAGKTTFIDVLPYNGDAYGTSYSGTRAFKDASFDATGRDENTTIYYSTTPSGQINPDPSHASNQPGGSTTWTSTRPADVGTITAIRFETADMPAGAAQAYTITMSTNGNDIGDVYRNRLSVGRSENLSIPIPAPPAVVAEVYDPDPDADRSVLKIDKVFRSVSTGSGTKKVGYEIVVANDGTGETRSPVIVKDIPGASFQGAVPSWASGSEEGDTWTIPKLYAGQSVTNWVYVDAPLDATLVENTVTVSNEAHPVPSAPPVSNSDVWSDTDQQDFVSTELPLLPQISKTHVSAPVKTVNPFAPEGAEDGFYNQGISTKVVVSIRNPGPTEIQYPILTDQMLLKMDAYPYLNNAASIIGGYFTLTENGEAVSDTTQGSLGTDGRTWHSRVAMFKTPLAPGQTRTFELENYLPYGDIGSLVYQIASENRPQGFTLKSTDSIVFSDIASVGSASIGAPQSWLDPDLIQRNNEDVSADLDQTDLLVSGSIPLTELFEIGNPKVSKSSEVDLTETSPGEVVKFKINTKPILPYSNNPIYGLIPYADSVLTDSLGPGFIPESLTMTKLVLTNRNGDEVQSVEVPVGEAGGPGFDEAGRFYFARGEGAEIYTNQALNTYEVDIEFTAVRSENPLGGIISNSVTLDSSLSPVDHNAPIQVNNGDVDADTDQRDMVSAKVGSPGLKIGKKADQDVSTLIEGSQATYTVTVHNNGDADAQNVVVTDSAVSGLSGVRFSDPEIGDAQGTTWNVGVLPAGGTATAKVTGTLTGGPASNSVSASADELPTPTGPIQPNDGDVNADTDQRDTTDPQTPIQADERVQVALKPQTGDAVAGSPYEYTVTVHNPGNLPLRNVVVDNAVRSGLTGVTLSDASTGTVSGSKWMVGGLAPGQTVTMTVRGTVAWTGDEVSNAVSVSADGLPVPTGSIQPNNGDIDADTDQRDVASTELLAPDLKVAKKPVGDVKDKVVGQNAEYEITVLNDGDSPARNVIVNDTAVSGLSNMTLSDASTGTVSGTRWTIPALNPGQRATVKVTGELTGGNVSNSVSAQATGYPVPTGAIQPNNGDITSDTDRRDVTNEGSPADVDHRVQVAVDADTPVVEGKEVTYTVTIHNPGNIPVDAAQVVADAVSGLSDVTMSNPSTGDVDGTTWDVGTLEPGETATVTITGTVTDEEKAQLDVAASAEDLPTPTGEVQPNNGDVSADTDQRDSMVSEVTSPTIQVAVSPDVDITAEHIGDVVTYTVTVRNGGTAEATNVVVDAEVSGLSDATLSDASIGDIDGLKWTIPSLAPGETATVKITAELSEDPATVTVIGSADDRPAPTDGDIQPNNGDVAADTDQRDMTTDSPQPAPTTEPTDPTDTTDPTSPTTSSSTSPTSPTTSSTSSTSPTSPTTSSTSTTSSATTRPTRPTTRSTTPTTTRSSSTLTTSSTGATSTPMSSTSSRTTSTAAVPTRVPTKPSTPSRQDAAPSATKSMATSSDPVGPVVDTGGQVKKKSLWDLIVSLIG